MEAKGQYVIIEPITRNELAQESVNIKGFTIQRKYEAEPNIGIVRFISKSIKNPECKVGDKVIFNEKLPQGFKHEGIGYIPVKYDNIIGAIND